MEKEMMQTEKLYADIRQILTTVRNSAYKAVNFAMVQAYWAIGELIVIDEQKGKRRAEYGKSVLEALSQKLMGLSMSTVSRAIKSLRQKEIIDREGSKKTGHWKIITKRYEK